MVLKLYGNHLSAYVKLAAIVLYEKHIPFEYVHVDFKTGEHKTPSYREKHPFGDVPYLDDDGFIIYESRAIARYLAEKYASQGPSLIPTDLRKKALFEQAASSEIFNFHTFAAGAVVELLAKPYHGLTPDQARVNELVEELSRKLDVYDQILSKQRYLAGDELTLADLFHLPFGTLLTVAGVNVIETKPNVVRWFNDLAQRDSWNSVKDEIRSIRAEE